MYMRVHKKHIYTYLNTSKVCGNGEHTTGWLLAVQCFTHKECSFLLLLKHHYIIVVELCSSFTENPCCEWTFEDVINFSQVAFCVQLFGAELDIFPLNVLMDNSKRRDSFDSSLLADLGGEGSQVVEDGSF